LIQHLLCVQPRVPISQESAQAVLDQLPVVVAGFGADLLSSAARDHASGTSMEATRIALVTSASPRSRDNSPGFLPPSAIPAEKRRGDRRCPVRNRAGSQNGSMDSALTAEQLAAIQAACRRHPVARLHAFGSVLRPDYRPGSSDIDLLVEFQP
jgi:hypothetical protein